MFLRLFMTSRLDNQQRENKMDWAHDQDASAAASTSESRLWQRVNSQHGLLDWTLGELYGIPSSCPSPRVVAPEPVQKQAEQQPRTWVCTRKLTRESVVAIFLVRLDRSRSASMLAREFGVTAKAIRDVWSQKSWPDLTSPHLLLPWKAGDYLPPGETSPLAITAAARVARAMAAAAADDRKESQNDVRLEPWTTLLVDEQKKKETPKRKRGATTEREKEDDRDADARTLGARARHCCGGLFQKSTENTATTKEHPRMPYVMLSVK
jgi:hypothetical protein